MARPSARGAPAVKPTWNGRAFGGTGRDADQVDMDRDDKKRAPPVCRVVRKEAKGAQT